MIPKTLKGKLIAFSMLLVFLGFSLYANSLNNSFHYDDKYLIVKNTKIYELNRVKDFFTSPLFSDIGGYAGYRPILMASYAINYHFSGPDPASFRVINLLLHILNTFFVFVIVFGIVGYFYENLKDDKRFLLSALTSLLFLFHPLNTIAINFIWKRSTLLSSFFLLAGLVCFVTFHLRLYDQNARNLLKRILSLFFINLMLLLALLSKETAVVFPFVLILIFIFSDKKNKAMTFALDLAPSLLIVAAFIWFRLIYVHAVLREMKYVGYIIGGIPSREEYALGQIIAITRYLKLLFFPQGLNIYHEVIVPHSFFDISMILRGGLLLGLISLSVFCYRRAKIVSFSVLWFFIFLVPTSSFFPLSILMDEIRVYMSVVSFSLIFASAIQLIFNLFEKRRGRKSAVWIVGIFTSFLLLFYAFNTMIRNTFYKNEIYLWKDSVEKSPNVFFPHLYLGNLYKDLGAYDEAKVEIEKAVKLDPNSTIAKVYLGIIYQNRDELDKAIEVYNGLLDKQVMNYYAHLNLGMIYKGRGENKKAIHHLSAACEIDNMGFDAFRELGIVYAKQKEYKKARYLLRRAFEINNFDVPTLNNLGFLLLEHFDLNKRAIEYFEKSLKIIPAQPLIKRALEKAKKN